MNCKIAIGVSVLETEVTYKNESDYNINCQLQMMINDYLYKYPSISLNGFANKSGVSGTTLRRIMHSKSRTPPAPHTILNIVSYIRKEKKISKLLDSIGGPVGEVLKKCFTKFIFADIDCNYSVDLNEVLKDRYLYIVYKLSANQKGTTLFEVINILGDMGRLALSKLVQLELIIENEEEQFHAVDKNFSLDLSIAKDHLPDLIKFYEPNKVHLGKNIFYGLSESLNERAIFKIKDIQRAAVKEIHKIMSDKDSGGEFPYFMITLSDTMMFSDENEELQ